MDRNILYESPQEGAPLRQPWNTYPSTDPGRLSLGYRVAPFKLAMSLYAALWLLIPYFHNTADESWHVTVFRRTSHNYPGRTYQMYRFHDIQDTKNSGTLERQHRRSLESDSCYGRGKLMGRRMSLQAGDLVYMNPVLALIPSISVHVRQYYSTPCALECEDPMSKSN